MIFISPFVEFFICFNYVLHQSVAHDIFFCKPVNAYIVDTLEDFHSLHQSGLFSVRQVYLGNIAGNDHSAVISQTGKEHLYLLRGGILRLIEDDERLIKSASPHVGERCYLDYTLFHIFCEALAAEHIKERIIQRTQIGVYLILEVTGKKSQLFTGFNCRTGEDYLPYLMLLFNTLFGFV